jgi:hypothetical protein
VSALKTECDSCAKTGMNCCYPRFMSRLALRFTIAILFMGFLSACGLVTPPTLATPPALCKDGQVSTEAEPCTPRPVVPEGTSNNPVSNPSGDNPTNIPTTPTDTPTTPKICPDTLAKVRTTVKLASQTTLKGCYTPGDSDSIYVSLKLKDSTVTFTEPTVVFDIVKMNEDKSTTSMAYSLLAGIPSANPDVFRNSVSKEDLLAGLETAVSLKFKSTAPVGKYSMVISLFVNTNAYDPANLVGRVFYAFEIKSAM